jgi:hypothetical protein
MSNTIYITGGTGFIGSKLSEFWRNKGYKVISISRSAGVNRIKYPESAEHFSEIINNSYALVNLAGASIVGKRWNNEYKKELYDSRIDVTKFCAKAIDFANTPPKLFISSSAIGIYGDRGDEQLDEKSSIANGFIADLCRDWEKASELNRKDVPVFIPRIGVVLDRGLGALGKMELPFKLFVGGPIGSGKQWFSWVDIDDLISAFDFALEKRLSGVHNIVSPNSFRMKDFAKTLGKVLGRPSWFPVPKFVLDIILGESSQEVLRSQKILPNSLIKNGFEYQYSSLINSLKKIFNK